jgi:hypothetical protein
MKSELIHLLHKLKAEHPDFQNLLIGGNGNCMVVLHHGCRRFETLDALEAYAWPPQENNESSVTLAPSAQDSPKATVNLARP